MNYYHERNIEAEIEKRVLLFESYDLKYFKKKDELLKLIAVFPILKKKYPNEISKLHFLNKILEVFHKEGDFTDDQIEAWAKNTFGKKMNTTEIFVYYHQMVKTSYYEFQLIRSLYFDTTLAILHYHYLIISGNHLERNGSANSISNILIRKSQDDLSEKRISGGSKLERYAFIYYRNYLFQKWPGLEILYYRFVHKVFYLLLSIFLILMSLMILFFQISSVFAKKWLNSILKSVFEWMNNDVIMMLTIVCFMTYLLSCVYLFFFQFNLFFTIGIKLDKKTNLPMLLNTSSYFTYFTFPLCMNCFQIFTDPLKYKTAFEVALSSLKFVDILNFNVVNIIPFIMIFIIIIIWFDLVRKITDLMGMTSAEDGESETISTFKAHWDIFSSKSENSIKEIENYFEYMKTPKTLRSSITTESYTRLDN